MNHRRILVLPLTVLVMTLVCGKASAENLNLCGIMDNGPGDTNPEMGVVEVFCALPNGFFNGTAREMVTPTMDTIIVTGRFTGSGSFPVGNSYPFMPGPGTLLAAINGTLESPGFAFSEGGEFMQLVDQASSFNNNPAQARVAFPNPVIVPAQFANSELRIGMFGGPGALTGVFTFNAGTRGVFVLPASGVLQAVVVPEPTTMLLFGTGLAGVGAAVHKRRKAHKGEDG